MKKSRIQQLMVIVIILVLVTLSACGSSEQSSSTATPSGTHFITFREFLASLDTAKFDDYAKLPGAKVRDAQAFEEMRAYIKNLYKGVKQVSSFISDGQYVDCITIQSQPSVLQLGIQTIAKPPTDSGYLETKPLPQPPGVNEFSNSLLGLGKVDPYGNPITCPNGTIPMERVTLERMVKFKTLHDFLSKGPNGHSSDPPLPENEKPGDASTHRYAYAYQSVTNYGGDSWLNLWNPSAKFSLSQQWYVGGSGNSTQTVEGGWVVYPDKFSSQAVLFIYWTADKYTNTGCYDLECSGFVQINNHWYLGGTWTNYSSAGGTQWGFELQWKLFSSNWWLFLKGPGTYEAVGYYPTSIYNGGQLATSASQIKYGGETDIENGSYPQMGSGQFASAGWQQAAYQHTIFYIPRDENDGVGVWASLTKVEASSSCYTIELTPASNGGNWGTYFFFGGPGGTTC